MNTDFDNMVAQAELDYQAFLQEMNDELLSHAEASMRRDAALNELSMDICGCPFSVIDEIVDEEVASHYKLLILNKYELSLHINS